MKNIDPSPFSDFGNYSNFNLNPANLVSILTRSQISGLGQQVLLELVIFLNGKYLSIDPNAETKRRLQSNPSIILGKVFDGHI